MYASVCLPCFRLCGIISDRTIVHLDIGFDDAHVASILWFLQGSLVEGFHVVFVYACYMFRPEPCEHHVCALHLEIFPYVHPFPFWWAYAGFPELLGFHLALLHPSYPELHADDG